MDKVQFFTNFCKYFFFLAIIEKIIIYDYYEAYKIIGMGAYGVVCSGKNSRNNEFVAIKKVIKLMIFHNKHKIKDKKCFLGFN